MTTLTCASNLTPLTLAPGCYTITTSSSPQDLQLNVIVTSNDNLVTVDPTLPPAVFLFVENLGGVVGQNTLVTAIPGANVWLNATVIGPTAAWLAVANLTQKTVPFYTDSRGHIYFFTQNQQWTLCVQSFQTAWVLMAYACNSTIRADVNQAVFTFHPVNLPG